MDCAGIKRKRDALHSYLLAVLEEARGRLEETHHDDAGGQLVPGASAAAAPDESCDTSGDDDFYPLDNDDDDELGQRPMQWEDQVCHQMVYSNNSRRLRQDDDDLVGHLTPDSDGDLHHHLDDNDDSDEISRDIVARGLQVPQIQSGAAIPPPFVPSEEAGTTSPMRGVAGNPSGAWSMDLRTEIQRKRDAVHSYLSLLKEARRRLDDAGGQLVPGAGGAAAADESSYTAGDNDFYPLDDDDEELGEERPMQWENQVCRQMVYNNNSRHLRQSDDDLDRHLAVDHSDDLDLDLDDNEDGDEISRDIVALGLHVPHIETGTATPPSIGPGEEEEAVRRRRGFGAVPASAAAIAGLKRHRYDGSSSGGDSMCVICMKDYKKGKRLRVMPCTYKHQFHGRCIREWLSWSNLCPLCRHALPTAADAEQGQGSGVHNDSRSTIVRVRVRVNVNPH